jgi:exodeoxyribonuclease V alpha subunit
MLFLHSYGISTNLATKIYKQYGDRALDIVRADPYQLARDIYGMLQNAIIARAGLAVITERIRRG